ncbi:MAG: pilus assembly FimT family protein [Terriglobales bacterium]
MNDTSPKIRRSRLPARAAGFSFTELLIAMTVLLVMLALAVVAYQKLWPGVKADAALDGVESQMRMARQDALTQRRTFELEFQAPNLITISRVEISGSLTAEPSYTLPYNATFQVFAGLPDTPDAFGDSAAIDFTDVNGGAGGDTLMFLSNGSVTDAAGNLVNGTVFMGLGTDSTTARAVTLYGITGIVHGYRYDTATDTFQ